MSRYTKDTLVQQTTAEYLRAQLSWELVYADNHEDFWPNSPLGRTLDRQVMLARTLRAKLQELNPAPPDAVCAEAIRQVTATTASQSLAATNRKR